MDNEKPIHTPQHVYKKAQGAIDHATEVRTGAAEELCRKHAEKTPREAAHVIDDGGIKRCSVCEAPFDPDVKPSLSVAFTEHLFKVHKPGQTSEDASQAAVRIVREATERH